MTYYIADDVKQEYIVADLQDVKWMGPHRAEYIVGQVNATSWSDFLDGNGLKKCIRDAVRGPVDPADVERLVISKEGELH